MTDHSIGLTTTDTATEPGVDDIVLRLEGVPEELQGWLPSTDMVGLILRGRTRDSNGRLGGIFTAQTDPTADQVTELIADAAAESPARCRRRCPTRPATTPTRFARPTSASSPASRPPTSSSATRPPAAASTATTGSSPATRTPRPSCSRPSRGRPVAAAACPSRPPRSRPTRSTSDAVRCCPSGDPSLVAVRLELDVFGDQQVAASCCASPTAPSTPARCGTRSSSTCAPRGGAVRQPGRPRLRRLAAARRLDRRRKAAKGRGTRPGSCTTRRLRASPTARRRRAVRVSEPDEMRFGTRSRTPSFTSSATACRAPRDRAHRDRPPHDLRAAVQRFLVTGETPSL
jgi:hypothetical protein